MANSDFRFPGRVKRRITEMFGSGTPLFGLRNAFNALRSGFYVAPTSPSLWDTTIDADKARQLYYNTDEYNKFGFSFARPIIDGVADYIGVPILSVQDEDMDDTINKWVNDYWKGQLWQAYRNSMREADTWIRIRRPFFSNLMAPDEEGDVVEIEVYDTDRVTAYYHPTTNELIRVEILTTTYVEDEPFDPAKLYAQGIQAHGRDHEIIEIITPNYYMYYDNTDSRLLEDFTVDNQWGFVPMVQVFNDYDSALHGGMAELENVYPWFIALQDVVEQTRQAHKTYANPKVKFKLDDVLTFLRNNFPDSFVNDQFTGKISWRDRDVMFMESAEDADFIEATMQTNDSVSLMDFLVDCICVAAEVTEEVIFRAKSEGSASTSKEIRFKKKVARKRSNYEIYIQRLVQMGLYILYKTPKHPSISWPAIEPQDLIDEATAMDHIVTSAEVVHRSNIISNRTYRAKIKPFFPAMLDNDAEEKAAQADSQAEANNEIKHQTALAAIPGSNGNGGGPNSARRTRVKAALPIDTAPPPASG